MKGLLASLISFLLMISLTLNVFKDIPSPQKRQLPPGSSEWAARRSVRAELPAGSYLFPWVPVGCGRLGEPCSPGGEGQGAYLLTGNHSLNLRVLCDTLVARTGSRTATEPHPPQQQEKAHLRKVNVHTSIQVPVEAGNTLTQWPINFLIRVCGSEGARRYWKVLSHCSFSLPCRVHFTGSAHLMH